MKIAYLIQAHDNYLHLKRLINALENENCFFYVHIDKKSRMPEWKHEKVMFIKNRVNVHWAGFSQVKTTLNLFAEAINFKYDYYALISGVDYPIKPVTYFEKKLSEGGEFIDVTEGYTKYLPKSRYSFYYFVDFMTGVIKKAAYKISYARSKNVTEVADKKHIPYKIFHGASWFVLSHACVKYILQQVEKDKKLTRFFKLSLSPDEAFFHTIIGNSDFVNTVKPYLTYTDWSESPGPAMITKKHIDIFKNEPYKFLARKFDDNSNELIQIIEKDIRKSYLPENIYEA